MQELVQLLQQILSEMRTLNYLIMELSAAKFGTNLEYPTNGPANVPVQANR